MDKFKEIKINKTLLIELVILVVTVGIAIFYLRDKNDNSVSVWDAEAAFLKEYKSYGEMEQELDKERNKKLEEYDKVIKGTIIEQAQNTGIPSYNDENQLAQLQQGEIEVREPKSEDFPDGLFSWSASLEKNVNSFAISDFNKDGLDDVAHIIGYTGGGSGYFYNLTVFINNQGKLEYLTQRELGDGVIIKNVKYERDLFVVDMITQGEGENFKGMCCPNVPTTIKFRLENNRLIRINN